MKPTQKKFNFLVILSFFAVNLRASQKYLEDGIYPYQPEHEKFIKKIALEHMPRLVDTWTFTQDEYQKLYLSDVKPALENVQYNPKVYLSAGKPIGFITYSFTTPYYRSFLSQEIGPDAKVHHLAIDSKFVQQGYGSTLLKDALTDCKRQGVSRVSLITTDPGLSNYYPRFGFQLVHRNKLAQSKYALRLKPHPAILFARSVLKFIKK